MGVAHVEAGDRAALEVPQDGPTGERVVDVPAHGGHCTGVAPAVRNAGSGACREPPAASATFTA